MWWLFVRDSSITEYFKELVSAIYASDMKKISDLSKDIVVQNLSPVEIRELAYAAIRNNNPSIMKHVVQLDPVRNYLAHLQTDDEKDNIVISILLLKEEVHLRRFICEFMEAVFGDKKYSIPALISNNPKIMNITGLEQSLFFYKRQSLAKHFNEVKKLPSEAIAIIFSYAFTDQDAMTAKTAIRCANFLKLTD